MDKLFRALGEFVRAIFSDQEHGTENETPERDPSPISSSTVRNSSSNNNDLLRQRDPTKSYYYEYYPNVSISSPTTKKPSAESLQSEYVSKSREGTNEASARLTSRTSPPSFSSMPYPSSPKLPQSKPSFPMPASASSKLSPSPSKSSPSLSGSSQLTSVPTPSSLKAPLSSKPTLSPLSLDSKNQENENLMKKDAVPKDLKAQVSPSSQKAPSSSKSTLSPLPLDSKNQQTKGKHIRVQKGTSPVYMTSKDNENLTKKDAVPEVLNKPLYPLSQKVPSSSKPTLSPLAPESTNQQKKASYIWVQEGTSSVYKIPKDIEDLIKEEIVPNVLKAPLSPSTYKDYFAALLYAEDFYYEKWNGFQLLNVTLEVHEASIYEKSFKNKHLKNTDQKDDKLFVAFQIDSVPERLPFLLSRDFVHAQRSGGKSKKFQGLLYRVVKSSTVLVEFEECFHSQHLPSNKYDISFSFNRVCLKRAHQAIADVSDPLFLYYLFPDCASQKSFPSSSPRLYRNYKLDSDINSAVNWILSSEGQPPCLVEGPLCVSLCVSEFVLSKTGIVVREAVVRICQTSPNSRILICAPKNRTCDVLTKSLMKDIPERDVFRANAAFREADEVPDDILQVSLLEGECFSCPSLLELRQYRVIFSTFVSSFRLHNKGISAGHFSHIFLVDASSAIEPETVIALSNLANENTTVIVTGAPRDCPVWVRSDIARKNGLKMSYFERLRQTQAYRS